jgi:hypothetical protein
MFNLVISIEIEDELKMVIEILSDGANQAGYQQLHDMPFGSYGQFVARVGVRGIFKGDHLKFCGSAHTLVRQKRSACLEAA